MVIQGFFNPRHPGDTFKGLNSSIEGKVADRVIGNLDDFLREAGRDYFIKKVPAFQRLSNGDFAEVENQYHLARSTDERIVSPHTVTDQYAPLSLMDIAEEVKPWTDAGWVTPDGVYEARGGSLELLSLRIDGGEEVPKEQLLHYILFQNPHGSGGTAKGKIITWRVVCANTFAAAIAAASDFVIRHRVAAGDPEMQKAIMAERAANAIAAWKQAREHISKLAARIGTLSSVGMDFKQAEAMTDALLDLTGKPADKVSKRAQNRKDAILRAFSMPQFGTFGQTAWDWYNGVTFANSSPLSKENQKSKVSAIDRMVRTTESNGTGFELERKASTLLAEFAGV